MALKKKSSELIDWNPELECWEGTISRRLTREWCDDNEYLHREGAPAEIEYHEDGTPSAEAWYLHGEPHREGAPAYIMYHEDGTPSGELWFLQGELHREGAPAQIWYHEDGTPSKGGWYLHGEKSTPLYSDETLVALVKALGIEGFRTHGKYFGFMSQIIDLNTLLK